MMADSFMYRLVTDPCISVSILVVAGPHHKVG